MLDFIGDTKIRKYVKLYLIVSVITIVIAMIYLSFFRNNNTTNQPSASPNQSNSSTDRERSTETDTASMKEVPTFRTGGIETDEPLYIGFEGYVDKVGVNNFLRFQDSIKEYSNKTNQSIEKVSLYMNSYDYRGKNETDSKISEDTFRIAINDTQKDLYIKFLRVSDDKSNIYIYEDQKMTKLVHENL